jgi:serine/threonine-protein kinase
LALARGTRLGVYEVTAQIGEGGMGQVYRAMDTTLGRPVAIKILPETFASDPDRLARFEREAKTLASLNHPHIAAVYGFEKSAGTHALVMELVEGEDLALRIARGAIPLDEALPIAQQIAEALEAAHEQGIIHRDLKPANIKVRPDGTVKVLDFGLAKALEPAGTSSVNATTSPTLSRHATMAGVILGTAAYMAPEQARGTGVDKRADIWAFGVVLYEMLTGERLFTGETISDTLASVLKTDPNWRALPPTVPYRLRWLLRWCLDKDPKRRLRDIGDARVQLEAVINRALDDEVAARPAIPRGRLIASASAVLIAGLVTAATVTWGVMRPHPPIPPTLVRFTVAPAGTLSLATGFNFRDLALSPDGEHLVYVTGTSPATFELWVRSVDQLDAVQLRGPIAPASPFISPDGKSVGFFSRSVGNVPVAPGYTQAGGTLMKVSMTGGPPIAICQYTETPRGASWGPNDTIVFATADQSTGLLSVAAGGGEPKVLTTPDATHGEVDHLFPSVMPGGQAVLFTITANSGTNSQVAALDLKTGRRKILVRGGGQAEYVGQPGSGPGYLIYSAARTLRAVRFDPVRLEVLSDAVPIVERVATKGSGAAEFSVSPGALVYLPAGGDDDVQVKRSLVWVNRQGREEPINAPPRAYSIARLSPDGMRIALDIRDQDSDIWTWDLAHETLTRITKDPAPDVFPVYTRDGRRILFASARNGVLNVYWQSADGSGTAERLVSSPSLQQPLSIAPDGLQVVVREGSLNIGNLDLLLLHLGASGLAPTQPPRIEPLVQTAFFENNGIISPDGRWFAYESNESSRSQIYVRPFPNVNGGLRQVSSLGGRWPLWAPNGRELFYVDDNGFLTTVPVQASATATFNFGNPTKLLDMPYVSGDVRTYDVSPDGQKFLMIKNVPAANREAASAPAPAPASMIVVLNWAEELKARLPAK